DASRNHSAAKPVACSSASGGLAPSLSLRSRWISTASGIAPPMMTAGLSTWSTRRSNFIRSVVPSQIHSCVQRSDLFCIAVERQRRTLEELADPALARLAPARVIDFRVHMGVEAVLARDRDVPRGCRLTLTEVDLHDRLAALEA